MIYRTLECNTTTNPSTSSWMKELSLFLIKRISSIITSLLEQLALGIVVALLDSQSREYTHKKGARYRDQDLQKGIELMLDPFNLLGVKGRVKLMLDLLIIRCRRIIFHLGDCKIVAFITKVANF